MSHKARRVLLTDALLENLLYADGRRYVQFDSRLIGFAVRVNPTGVKSFVQFARIKGHLVCFTIGRFPEYTVDLARGIAAEWKRSANNGIDTRPRKEKKADAGLIARRAATIDVGVGGKSRWANLRYVYGLTEHDYRVILASQNSKCRICRTAKPGGRNGLFHVDHDHKTGRVRGLLCHKCNVGIGMLREDWRILKAAIEYLRPPKGALLNISNEGLAHIDAETADTSGQQSCEELAASLRGRGAFDGRRARRLPSQLEENR